VVAILRSVTDVVFFVSAHPDDALLFRGDVLYGDLHIPDYRVVHIVVTAGDAGRTDGWWQVRESGAVDALRATTAPDLVQGGKVDINGMPVSLYETSYWACYCLRLPDGGLDGNGFPATENRSLSRLQAGQIASLTTVDNSATYSGWQSVPETLKAIFARERLDATTTRPWVNASDHDRTANPNDHPDHYATADALRSFDTGYSWAWWVSYDSRDRPANVSGFDYDAKRLLFAAYGKTTGGVNETEWGWWGARRYQRIEA
jgi:LmbE family N-acetylglucosaminyl deacetylase